jgi:ABC-type multidrug transport system permease subunit
MRSLFLQLRIEHAVFIRDPTVVAFHVGLPLLLFVLLTNVRINAVAVGDGLATTLNEQHHLVVQGYRKMQDEGLSRSHRNGIQDRIVRRANASGAPSSALLTNESIAQRVAAELLPGMVGMVVASVGLFGFGSRLASYRQRGLLRLLAVTPNGVPQFISVQILHRFVFMILQSSIIIAVGQIAFGAVARAEPFRVAAMLATGSLAFIGMGFLVATVSSNVERANGWSHLLFAPMLIVSGAFFPSSALPWWLGMLAPLLPMTYLIDGLHTAIHGTGPVFVDAVALLGFAAASLSLTFLTFSPLVDGTP